MCRHLEALCGLSGVSGDEGQVQNYIIEALCGIDGILECRTDRLGNLIVHKKGQHESKRRVMLAAHMDEVGLIVTAIRSDGTLSIAPVGGIEPSVLIGRQVRVNGMNGVIGAKAVHHLSAAERDAAPTVKQLSVDIGAMNKEEAEQVVQLGDIVSFVPDFQTMGEDFVCSKAIDDRVGCAILLDLLESELPYDMWFAFTVQEEVGLRGGKTAAFAIDPELALVLETTTAADYPDISGADRVCELGKGAVVPFMDRTTLYDRALYQLAWDVAKEQNIAIQTKTKIAGGNDAGVIHTTRSGVRTLTISVPCRNLHSPATIAKQSDISACRALAEAILPRLETI
ncbi:MAG: M42 family peptidase [Ruminococcus sp.]|nr:M42 family peptidase [Ruminococcus sp.]